MMRRLRSARHDEQAGFTLVELLVTMSIMAIAFIVLLGAISVFLSSTRVHRGAADLDAAMRTYVERLNDDVLVGYMPCASSYAVPAASLPAGYLAKFQPTVSVKYWDGNPAPAAFGAACTTPDRGEQQLTVTLTRTSDGQRDSLVIVKRDEVQP